MRCLITGANGFLGSWLCRRLISEGIRVRIICRPTSDLSEIAGLPIEICHGDVTDPASIEKAMNEMDAVFHLAGLIAYKPTEHAHMQKINVQGTQNMVDACLKFQKIKPDLKFLHLSSVAAIGASFDGKQILNENFKYNLNGMDFGYFDTKKQAEDIVLNSCKTQGLHAVAVNPTTIYGGGDARKGSRKTQLKVAQGKFPFYPPGGANVVHVEDVVEGIWQAFHKGKQGERYILASENLTIKKVFELIAQEANVAPPKIALPKFALYGLGLAGDLARKFGKDGSLSLENARVSCLYHWFDASKAQKEFGIKFRPSQEAIRDSVQWSKAQGLI